MFHIIKNNQYAVKIQPKIQLIKPKEKNQKPDNCGKEKIQRQKWLKQVKILDLLKKNNFLIYIRNKLIINLIIYKHKNQISQINRMNTLVLLLINNIKTDWLVKTNRFKNHLKKIAKV